jgi:hypothetical protein
MEYGVTIAIHFVNVSIDERVLGEDGNVDSEKLSAISFFIVSSCDKKTSSWYILQKIPSCLLYNIRKGQRQAQE